MAKRRTSAKRKIKKKISKIIIFLTVLVLAAIVGLFVCDHFGVIDLPVGEKETERETIAIPPSGDRGEDESKSASGTESGTESETETEELPEEISVHIIDVGQGDAILIMTESGNMLIDSGDLGNTPRQKLTDYLTAHNVTSFEYAVFTHTDADHIGSADYIVENYEVKNVIMPDYAATTKVYSRLIEAIEKKKDVNLILIGEDTEVCEQSGYTFTLGPITNTVMGPTKDFKDANEMSVVIKSVYGETSILFTGDAEHKSEEAMLEKYTKGELDCDILKVGHHGSSTSTTDEFLDAVSPEVALISCGDGNKYGHPNTETTDKLDMANIKIFRTDHHGSIVITTDGVTYSVTTEK